MIQIKVSVADPDRVERTVWILSVPRNAQTIQYPIPDGLIKMLAESEKPTIQIIAD